MSKTDDRTDPVDTDALRGVGQRLAAVSFHGTMEQRMTVVRAQVELVTAADEVDRLRAVNEFGMNRLVKSAADEWFDECAPNNVSMDDLNLLVHMITEAISGDAS